MSTAFRPGISKVLWRCLLVTLSADTIAAAALGLGELRLARTLWATLAAGILFAIAFANFLGAIKVLREAPSWARYAFVAQLAVLLLALYIIVIDAQSPVGNPSLMAIAVTVALSAFIWLVRLAGQAAIVVTRTGAIIAALIPLAGAGQFWLQNYYIPDTSVPLVDIATDLSPQDTSGSITHLSAKLTIHNRSTVRINVAAELMRVTAYPLTTPQDKPPVVCRHYYKDHTWCLEGALDPSGTNPDADFRAAPTPAANAHLLYASLLGNGPTTVMAPGESDTVQREVDLDSRQFHLARLSVSALFLTERDVKDIRSCFNSKASYFTDSETFAREVEIRRHWSRETNIPMPDRAARASYLCMSYEIAPRNVIDWAIGAHIVLRSYIHLNDPQDPGTEYPQLGYFYSTVDRIGRADPGGQLARKIELANPLTSYTDVSVEYVPGDPGHAPPGR